MNPGENTGATTPAITRPASGDLSYPTYVDFGTLSKDSSGSDLSRTFTLTNKSNYDINLSASAPSGYSISGASGTLSAGSSTTVTVQLSSASSTGKYDRMLNISTFFKDGDGSTYSISVQLYAEVVEKKLAPLTVEPETLDFGIVEEGYTALAQKTVTVKNNAEHAIRLDQPTSYNYEISLLTQTSLPAGGSTTFSIRPRTGLPANAYNGVVELYGSGESAKLNVQFAVTRPAGPAAFSDVAAGSTFAADITYVSQEGLMSGVGEGRFNPGAPVTRGQLVTILYRLEGQPAVSGAGFPDVAAGSYCEKAVKWASANGITAGGKDGLFRPGDSITRQQLAAFLFRYNAYKGYAAAQRADLGTFSDGAAAASYAREALSWANAAGLVNGTADGRLNPSGGATRGQAAAILHRFCVSIGK